MTTTEQRLANTLRAIRASIVEGQPGITDTLWMHDTPSETVVDRIDAVLASSEGSTAQGTLYRGALEQRLQDVRDDLLLSIGLAQLVQAQACEGPQYQMLANSLMQRTEALMNMMAAERATRPR